MANMFGIEYDSPAEIKDQITARLQKLEQKAAGDPIAGGRVAQQKALVNLFGTPELRAAKAKQKVLEEVQRDVTKDEGEDDFDYQMRLAETIREKAASVKLPELALQANDQILALRSSQVNQRRLQAQTEGEELKLKEAKELAVTAKQGWVLERQEDGELRPIRKLSDTQPTEEDLARFEEMREENPNLVLGSGIDVLKIENLLPRSGKRDDDLNNSAKQKHLESLTSAKGFARDVANFATTLSEDVEALGLGRDALTTVDSVSATADRFKAEFLETVDNDPEKAEEAEGIIESVLASEAPTASAIAKAQVQAMAYKLARTLDSGGRLSDQDVRMAIEMIIGSGRSTVIEKLLRERLHSTYEGLEATIDLANAGRVYGDVGKREVARVEKVMQEARDAIDLYNQGIQEAKKPGRKGIDPNAPPPAADEQPAGSPPKPTHRFNPATGKIEAL